MAVVTLVDRILPPLDKIRGIVGRLGLHDTPLALKSWVWSSGRIQTGVPVPRADVQIGSVPPSWTPVVTTVGGGIVGAVAGTALAGTSAAGAVAITTATPHGLVSGMVVDVAGVLGTVEANGQWVAFVVDASHLELVGTTFAHAYTGGGTLSWTQTVVPPHARGTSGDVEMGVQYITPAWFAADGVTQLGGYTPAQLAPADAPGLECAYFFAWPHGGRYYALAGRGLDTSNPLHYGLKLVGTDRKVPW